MKTVEHAEFEPGAMQSMIDALATTGRVLRLSDRHSGLAIAATRKIIELAKASEREAERLTAVFGQASRRPPSGTGPCS